MTTGKLAKRYNPIRPLGEGAMGIVWLMDDLVDRRQVALKAVNPGPDGAKAVGTALAFKQEFRLMTRLRHPNCCEVYDYGVDGQGQPYFTMEVVPGAGLDELLPLTVPQLRDVLAQLLRALGHVHDLGFVHGDIKPANVRVTESGIVKLMDYGLMEHTGRTNAPIRGTLAYLAPEVVRRATIDQRADLYAVGALAYELWTGQVPFLRSKPIEVLRAQVEECPDPMARHRAGLSDDLARLIERLLAKDPLDRPQSAYEALAEIGILDGEAGGARLLTSAMVGRELESGQLGKLLEAVGRQQPGALVALWGTPGVGKSRLAAELRFEAQVAGLAVATTPNHEFAQSPYGPVVRLLRALMPAIKAHVREDLDRLASVLAKVLPELGVTAAPELDPPATEKMRLQSAMADIILALATAAGLVLVLEDWQWADPLSDQFLDHLARNAGDAPLLLVTTTHDDPTRRLRAGAWHERATTMHLAGLSGEAVGRLMASMLGMPEVDAALVARMAALSEGNPYMVELILDHVVQIGALKRERGHWRFEEPVDAAALPNDLLALQGLKLERLDATARLLARTAAAIGYIFDLALLKRVTGLDEETLFAAVDALDAHHVFVETDPGHYRFSRDQLQDMLYMGTEPAERLQLHTTIARAMEAAIQASDDADTPLDAMTMIADQYMRGNVPEKTIAYCLVAGIRHARLFATADASRYLEAGLAALGGFTDKRWWRAKLDYLSHLGDVRRLLGDYDGARRHYEAGLPLAELLEDQFRACRMWNSLAKIHQVQQRFDEALEAARSGILLASSVGDDTEVARGLMTAGRIRYFMGDVPAAISDHEQAWELATQARDPGKAHAAAAFLGYLLATTMPERADEGMALMLGARVHLDAVGDKIGMNNTLDFLGNAQVIAGDVRAARETFTRKLAICQEVGYRDEASSAHVNLAGAAFRLGELQAAAAEAQAALELATAVGSPMPIACAHAWAGAIAAHTGEVALALRDSREALGQARGRTQRYLESVVLPIHVETLVEVGLFDEARTEAEALRHLIAESGHADGAPLLLVLRAELAADPEQAAAYATEAVDAAHLAGTQGVFARALMLQARLALAAGTWDDAASRLAETRVIVEPLGLLPQQTRLELLAGELALALGRPAEATLCYEAALAFAQAMGAPSDRALALFGLAASRPYDSQATGRAQGARTMLDNIVSTLGKAEAAAYLATPERHRVVEGNYVGLSLPRRQSTSRKTGGLPPVMRDDMWKRF